MRKVNLRNGKFLLQLNILLKKFTKLYLFINLVNWNILVTKGKKIKRDFKSSGERNWKIASSKIKCYTYRLKFLFYYIIL